MHSKLKRGHCVSCGSEISVAMSNHVAAAHCHEVSRDRHEVSRDRAMLLTLGAGTTAKLIGRPSNSNSASASASIVIVRCDQSTFPVEVPLRSGGGGGLPENVVLVGLRFRQRCHSVLGLLQG